MVWRRASGVTPDDREDVVSEKNRGGRPPKYVNKAKFVLLIESEMLEAVELVARAEGVNRQALIQKAVRDYIERNHPAALQPGARITATITADHAE